MADRLTQLLDENQLLYGMLCRDATLTDLELIAQAGYHIVWIDMEHAPYNPAETVRFCRTIIHLGMVPMVRIAELTKTHVQMLLDGGVQILLMPHIEDDRGAAELVRLSKFPPYCATEPRDLFTLLAINSPFLVDGYVER